MPARHRGSAESAELQNLDRGTASHGTPPRYLIILIRDELTRGHVLPLVSVFPADGRCHHAARVRLGAARTSG